LFNDTNIQRFFELANFIKDIFKIFSKVLIIKEKKQQLTAHKQKPKFHRTMPTLFVPSLICEPLCASLKKKKATALKMFLKNFILK
jgi:hypothetical protein